MRCLLSLSSLPFLAFFILSLIRECLQPSFVQTLSLDRWKRRVVTQTKEATAAYVARSSRCYLGRSMSFPRTNEQRNIFGSLPRSRTRKLFLPNSTSQRNGFLIRKSLHSKLCTKSNNRENVVSSKNIDINSYTFVRCGNKIEVNKGCESLTPKGLRESEMGGEKSRLSIHYRILIRTVKLRFSIKLLGMPTNK